MVKKMLKILYEDNHILVCVKPKGVLSQADISKKPNMVDLLKDYIKEKYNKPGNVYLGLVHRLDINTSGVMVFAKTSKAAKRLSEDIKNHNFEKKYYATVEGIIDNEDYILLKSYLKKDEQRKISYESYTGSEAILEYKKIKSYKIGLRDVTDVDIILKTGKFHQIRAQMALIGHPLYGDKKYGSKIEVDYESFPLCAYSISFHHPITKEWLTFSI